MGKCLVYFAAVFAIASVLVSVGQTGGVKAAVANSGRADLGGFTGELKEAADLLRLPGYSIAVVHDGKVIYRLDSGQADIEGHLPVKNDTPFLVASVTKSFTAVMMMQYVGEKKISLDDYLLKYPFDSAKYAPNTIDVDTRLKHVLSMTSGDVPGMTFNYNGWRYSLLSGVFGQLTQMSPMDAYRHEIEARILGPLHLQNTFDGLPDKPTALTRRVAKGYHIEPGAQGVVYRTVPYDAANYYAGPSAGLFTTIDDLATYTTALDDGRLLSPALYDQMTTPYLGSEGQQMPYGYGWMSQTFHGLKLHWVYGEGRLDAALLLRVPERHLTLIMLTNSVAPSSAARLHDGDVLKSPFAIAFLKYFVLSDQYRRLRVEDGVDIAALKKRVLSSLNSQENPLIFDELIAQAECHYYMADLLHEKTTRPEELLRLLYEVHPQSFDTADAALMWMMARIDSQSLREATNRLIRSFDVSIDHRPEVLYSIGAYYELTGDRAGSIKYFKLLADRPGFGDEWYKVDASLRLGRLYRAAGEEAKGRAYIWQSALESRSAGFDAGYMRDRVLELNHP